MIGSPYTTIPGDRKRGVFKLLHRLTGLLITMETMGRDDVTFLSGFRNDISSRFAHHLGDVQRTVSLFSNGDGTEHCFRLNLQHNTIKHHCAVVVVFSPHSKGLFDVYLSHNLMILV